MTQHTPLATQDVHDLLRRVFDAFTDPATKPEDYSSLLSPRYVQSVDGKVLDYAGFLKHCAALQEVVISSSVTFERIVTDGLSAATVHIAEVKKVDGTTARLKVIAYYEFCEGRVCRVDELTHLLNGEAQDRDLGSRTAS